MVDNIIRQMSKGTWYKLSLYINVILFFIIALFMYFLVKDCLTFSEEGGDTWLFITRDIAFIAVALSLIFFQFFRNLYIIMRRSL